MTVKNKPFSRLLRKHRRIGTSYVMPKPKRLSLRIFLYVRRLICTAQQTKKKTLANSHRLSSKHLLHQIDPIPKIKIRFESTGRESVFEIADHTILGD